MTYILHLGHQDTDLAGVAGRHFTTAGSFDASIDVNSLRYSGTNAVVAPFSFPIQAPSGDLWLGFRYVPPTGDVVSQVAGAKFLEFRDAAKALVAQILPTVGTPNYNAVANGDTTVTGATAYVLAPAQVQWLDVRVAVGANITIDFYQDGVLMSTATAANTAGKGKPVLVTFANAVMHSGYGARAWSYAHIAALDGVSTIGRRFVRRTPDLIGFYNQMAGSIDALKDNDIATRVASDTPGQRMSFSLAGPAVAASAIAGVHVKQVAQGGTTGPASTADFLRIGGVNYDAAVAPVSTILPEPVYASWALNPADSSAWTDLTLPTEVGILSAT